MQFRTGIGLRHPHYRDVITLGAEQLAPAQFVEVHSENFFGDGGASLAVLQRAREKLPVSLHGVGLGLGNARGIDLAHLRKLKVLVDRIDPWLISEHVCWNGVDLETGGVTFNDLLPLPYTKQALNTLCANIARTQDALNRRILIENASAYVQFAADEMDEFSFIAEAARRTDCGILLDVNNLYVNAVNFNFDPLVLLRRVPAKAVAEIHLAGHLETDDGLIDDHGSRVSAAVWNLYRAALAHVGPVPTLIEWDTNIPPLNVLLHEAGLAQQHALRALSLAVQ